MHIPSKIRLAFLIFLLVSILCTFGDELHVLSKIDGYHDPILPLPGTGQPIWVPFLFGTAALIIAASHIWVDRVSTNKNAYYSNMKDIILGVLAFLTLYALSAFLPMEAGG